MRKDVDDWWEYGWVFQAVNTNKRSVTLNLESLDGIRLLKALVAESDAVIENFSPRVMEHFGLGADALLAVNPRLVVMRMPAFGLDGPWRDRVGICPDHGADRRNGLADRSSRGSADSSARASATRSPARTPPSRCWPLWTSPVAPARVSWSKWR